MPPRGPVDSGPYDDRRVKLVFLGRTERPGEVDRPTLHFFMIPRNVAFDGAAQPGQATYFSLSPTRVSATVWDHAVVNYAADAARVIEVTERRRSWWLPFAAQGQFHWKLFDRELEGQVFDLWAGTLIKVLFRDHRQRTRAMYRRMYEEFRDYFDSTRCIRGTGADGRTAPCARRLETLDRVARVAVPVLSAVAYATWDYYFARRFGGGGLPLPLDLACYGIAAFDLLRAGRSIHRGRVAVEG